MDATRATLLAALATWALVIALAAVWLAGPTPTLRPAFDPAEAGVDQLDTAEPEAEPVARGGRL